MARMFPSKLPSDTYSKGEQNLYRKLQEQLPDDYVVIHGARLTLSKTMQADDEGEIDFLILHRDHPLMVLEVKDKSAIDIQEGRWLTRTNAGLTPPGQAKKNARILRDMLRTERQTQNFKFATKQFVAFTNLSIPQDGWVASDLPRDRVLDLNDCQDLAVALPKMAGRTTRDYRLSKDALQAVVKFLARDLTIKVPELRFALERSEEQIVEMNSVQHHILKMLGTTPRIAIPGCAGSGKTMLAMENARLLARQKRRVLLTCHTSELAKTMRLRMRDATQSELDLITVEHFHGMARRVLGDDYTSLKQTTANENEFYERVLPETLFDQLPEMEDRYDAIIADEGQDFHELSWDVLDGMLEQPGTDALQIFFDDNQRVFKRDAKLTVPISPIHLNVNFRNTDSIHEWVRRYHQNPDSVHAAGIDGPVPEIIPADEGDCTKQVQKLLDRLVNQNEVRTQNIVVLTPWNHRNPRTSFPEELRLGNFQLSRKKPPKNLGIAVRTISAFKGMESPIVILTELAHLHGDSISADLYVGLSRARSQLYIIGELPDPPKITSDRLFQVTSIEDSRFPSLRTRKVDVEESPSTGSTANALPAAETTKTFRYTRSAVQELVELDDSQRSIVTHAVAHGTKGLVTGGPGTGKTLILLRAAAEIVDSLLLDGVKRPRVLFATYTRALERACRQQLREILGDKQHHVEVRTADSLGKRLVEETGELSELVEKDSDLLRLVRAAIARSFSVDSSSVHEWAMRRSVSYLEPKAILEEINHVIEGRLIDNEREYQALDPGRIALRLNSRQRGAIWRIYQEFNELLAREGRMTWSQLRRRALRVAREGGRAGNYHAVIVDEVQDLELALLRLLEELVSSGGRFLLSADPNQSIYPVRTDLERDFGEGFDRWQLTTSYRSPREVMEAANTFVRTNNTALPIASTSYIRSGRQPILRTAKDDGEELRYLIEYFRWIQGSSDSAALAGSCLLVPTRERGEALADALSDHGVSAVWMTSDRLDLRTPGVIVMTLHSAKGLEFRDVAIAGFHRPSSESGAVTPAAPAIFQDKLLVRKLLYVGMTRSTRTLLLVRQDSDDGLLFDGFDATLWDSEPTGTRDSHPIP